ncbi:Heptaprenyl diphosphate synthase component I, partial [Dysosmobacter welbionis]
WGQISDCMPRRPVCSPRGWNGGPPPFWPPGRPGRGPPPPAPGASAPCPSGWLRPRCRGSGSDTSGPGRTPWNAPAGTPEGRGTAALPAPAGHRGPAPPSPSCPWVRSTAGAPPPPRRDRAPGGRGPPRQSPTPSGRPPGAHTAGCAPTRHGRAPEPPGVPCPASTPPHGCRS